MSADDIKFIFLSTKVGFFHQPPPPCTSFAHTPCKWLPLAAVPRNTPPPSLHTRELLCTNKSFHCAAQKPEQPELVRRGDVGVKLEQNQLREHGERLELHRLQRYYVICSDRFHEKKGGDFYL